MSLLIVTLLILSGGVTFGEPHVIVDDDLGRKIDLAGPPQRIVSLEPSVTEILYAVGAESKIAADDDYSDYPPPAKRLPHVNGIGPSREMMIGLRPDLIILYDQTFTKAKADQWQSEYNAPIIVLNAGTYSGIEKDIALVGRLAGVPGKTRKVLDVMSVTQKAVERAVVGRKVVKAFVIVWDRPLMTAGRGSYYDDLIRLAGGVDVASKTAVGYPTYSPERLVADNPDYLLTGTLGTLVSKQQSSALATLNLRAIKLGHCYGIPDDWTARPGPRLSLGLVAIARVLHPEAFRVPH